MTVTMAAGWNTPGWQIRPPASECRRCGTHFADGQPIRSRLLFVQGEGYRREDICEACVQAADSQSVVSWWRGVYRMPPPPPPEPVRKETAESLLRRLIEEARADQGDVIFVLAVMLERKKVLVERDVQRQDGRVIRVYEHRRTGESWVIPDPGLRLADLERVQRRVLEMLGEPSPPVPTAEPANVRGGVSEPQPGGGHG